MATWKRSDIVDLSNRLEVRAAVMSAEAGRDIMSAACLLRLLVQLSDVQKIETTVGGADVGHA
jgi:hypothetical protein